MKKNALIDTLITNLRIQTIVFFPLNISGLHTMESQNSRVVDSWTNTILYRTICIYIFTQYERITNIYKPVGIVKTTDVVTKGSRVKFYGFGHILHVHNRVSKRWSHDIRRHSFQSWFSDPKIWSLHNHNAHHETSHHVYICKISLYGQLNTWATACNFVSRLFADTWAFKWAINLWPKKKSF